MSPHRHDATAHLVRRRWGGLPTRDLAGWGAGFALLLLAGKLLTLGAELDGRTGNKNIVYSEKGNTYYSERSAILQFHFFPPVVTCICKPLRAIISTIWDATSSLAAGILKLVGGFF